MHSSVNGCLSCFHLLPNVNNVAVTMSEQISVQVPAFQSFGYILRNETARIYGNSVFNFLRNCHNIFCCFCPILHSFQQHTKIPNRSYPCQHLLFSGFYVYVRVNNSHTNGVKCYLIVVLICISQMISYFEKVLICLWVVCLFCLEKFLFKFFVHFLNQVLLLLSKLCS